MQNRTDHFSLMLVDSYTSLMRLVIDSFEQDLARVELDDGRTIDLLRAWLPNTARIGDHIEWEITPTGKLLFRIDTVATTAAREKNQNQLNALNSTDNNQDIKI